MVYIDLFISSMPCRISVFAAIEFRRSGVKIIRHLCLITVEQSYREELCHWYM